MTQEEKQKIGASVEMIAKSLKATFWTGLISLTIVIFVVIISSRAGSPNESGIPAQGLIAFFQFAFSLVALFNFWAIVTELFKISKVYTHSD